MQNLISKLGELNPQLFREIKGRLKTRGILIIVFLSLILQLMILGNTPNTQRYALSIYNFYNGLSFSVIIAILVSGTYVLINDLATEQQRGTLNFIRLSPQSSHSIFFGKMLGVHINGYIAILLVIPIHLWMGLKLNLPLHQILISYIISIAASIFYYSAGILFALVGFWLGNAQSRLAGGFIAIFLLFNQEALCKDIPANNPLVLFKLIHPQYFLAKPDNSFNLATFNWFGLPLGESFVISATFSLLVYSIGTYFIWQSIERCYHNPQTTMLSKKQSYCLTASFTAITLGCASSVNNENLFPLIFLNFGIFLYLIAALTPNYQTLQDWARYQHFYSVKHPGKQKLVQDLIWGEKSPAILAIAINALIPLASASIFISLSSMAASTKINAVVGLIFIFSLVLIYATLAQLMLFMKNEQRLLWTNTIMAAVILLPIIILGIFASINNSMENFLWFFTILSPVVILSPQTNILVPLLALLGHATILGLLLSQIKGRLHKVGQSATKVLLAEN
ncbi:hypothetical protein VB620_18890 [Nodularia harveyana UHCC-0300]|uniref:ABC transporter permease n=1 Tax=Nodularia harveyana UHCC-0300 TaxID=2974287 RepID=A0ABU5UIR9_9CYAN|nr:hypothetical protein [Nodularia harveyana]MEA5583400.1 hypothetical protein [Nodularia harveyana UHCC-0300]